MNKYKLIKGASFAHFYYQAMSYTSSKELKAFLIANEWYFRKQASDVQEQIKERFIRIQQEEKRHGINDK